MGFLQRSIMVVDDEEDIGYFLKHYLSVKSYDVSLAYTAEQAFRMMQEKPVDIVVLDMVMKGMSGADAAKIIHERFPSTKIIVVTAYPDEADRIEKDIPLAGRFIKPMGIEDLFIKLQGM
jgi:DNA-binding response OmpR family regulator